MPAALFLVVLADVLGWSMVLPVLPSWAQARGAGPEGVALLFSAYAGVQLLASPLLGRLADRVGAQKVLLFCLAGSCASFVWLALAPSYHHVLASRLLDGLTAGNLPIAAAMAARLTEGGERARAFGRLGIAQGIGLVVGPICCIVLLKRGDAAPLWGAAVASALSFALALALPKVAPLSEAEALPLPPPLLVQLPAAARRCAVLLGLFFTAHHLFASGWGLFSERWYTLDHGTFGARALALSLAWGGFSVVATQLFIYPRALASLGERGTVALGFLAAALGFAALPFAVTESLLGWAIAVTALGTALSRPVLTAWLSRATPQERQGEVMGLLQSLQSGAQLAGPLATGALLGAGLLRGWVFAVASLHATGLALVALWPARALAAEGGDALDSSADERPR